METFGCWRRRISYLRCRSRNQGRDENQSETKKHLTDADRNAHLRLQHTHRILAILYLWSGFHSSSGFSRMDPGEISIIPKPVKLIKGIGSFVLDSAVTIVADRKNARLAPVAGFAESMLLT